MSAAQDTRTTNNQDMTKIDESALKQMSTEQIRDIERFLQCKGKVLTPDGVVDDRTIRALREWRQEHKLSSRNAVSAADENMMKQMTGLRLGGCYPETVKSVQEFLRTHGHPNIAVDGIVGPKTLDALEAWKKSAGTSRIGPRSLDEVLSPNDLLCIGCASDAVRELQKKLHKQGLYDGPIDGIFGEKTLKGVIDFQKKNELNADGIVGSITRKKLGM